MPEKNIPQVLTEDMYVNNRHVDTELQPIGFQKDAWYLLDDCFLAKMHGKVVYTAHAVRIGDEVVDGKAPLYKVGLPIVAPDGETALEQIGGDMADVCMSEKKGIIRVDEQKMDLLHFIERDLKDAPYGSVEVLSAGRLSLRPHVYHIAGILELDGKKNFVSWECNNVLGAGFGATGGHSYEDMNDAMIDHICCCSNKVVSDYKKLHDYGVNKALANFVSDENIHEVKKVTDYIAKAAVKNPEQIQSYAGGLHYLAVSLTHQKKIQLTPVQADIAQKVDTAVRNGALYQISNKKLCEKMVQTIRKAVDQAYNRQQGR